MPVVPLKRGRAPLWHQIVSHIERGDLSLYEEADIYAVINSFEVPVRYFVETKKGIREKVDLIPFPRGIVVSRRRRLANAWEVREYGHLSEEELSQIHMERWKGKLYIYIAERIESLWHAARQLARHAPSTYLGIKVKLNRRALMIAGDFQRLSKIQAEISEIQTRLAKLLATTPLEEVKKASQKVLKGVEKILEFIQRVRRAFNSSLPLEEAKEAPSILESQKKLAEAGMKTLEAMGEILQIVTKLLEKAEKRVQLDLNFREILKESYQSLGELAKETEKISLGQKSGKDLSQIGQEAEEIYQKISQIFFDPYFSEVVWTAEFRGLSRAKKQAEKAKPETLLNTLRLALKKIEKFVLGEVPELKEIEKTKTGQT